jgi:diaminohydroxyphosphoribosylaminopyrimidine deaminase / 5-amino-6-(5-phosphoribosylamino)uracil reductase
VSLEPAVDTAFMSRALALAERGRGRTSPNPMVGAVIVDDEGVVVGQGSHEVAGGPHAEVFALQNAGDRARGGTLYCTLEPCSHTGRTGPCAPRVVDSGVHRAVIAIEDPNPLVAGRGIQHLRQHGIEVTVGVLADEAERLNAPFLTTMRARRPFVTMKVALSRDGRVAARPGTRTALTGSAANRLIHRERAEVDAIGIGSGTVLADDPLLTARGAYRARPLVRVIFDRSLRTPPSARMLSTLEAGPIIVMSTNRHGPEAARRGEALKAAGARVEAAIPDSSGFLCEALESLAGLGVTSIVLEGGPTLHAAAWSAGLVDRVQIFTTPWTLGAGGLSWLDGPIFSLDALIDRRTVRLGDDVMMEGYVHRPD